MSFIDNGYYVNHTYIILVYYFCHVVQADECFSKKVSRKFLHGDNALFYKLSLRFVHAALGGEGKLVVRGSESLANFDRLTAVPKTFSTQQNARHANVTVVCAS